MTEESQDYLEMAYRSMECFTNDGVLLVPERDQLVTVALRDGVVDDNEKRVLGAIIARLGPAELTPEMQARIGQLRVEYAL